MIDLYILCISHLFPFKFTLGGVDLDDKLFDHVYYLSLKSDGIVNRSYDSDIDDYVYNKLSDEEFDMEMNEIYSNIQYEIEYLDDEYATHLGLDKNLGGCNCCR